HPVHAPLEARSHSAGAQSQTDSEASSDRGQSRDPAAPRSLGGIRSRAPPAAIRRYGRTTPAGEERAPPDLRGSRSSSSLGAAGVSRSEGLSLLSRLAMLTASRPNVQDMVSNRSSPRFVKRSLHHQTAPPAAEQPSASITWGRYERRYR
ncbi:hypothetical protein H4R18_003599, partial [Coemansia javaensis]